ncbi:MAG: SBBP repeat-containing protein, partial [bacterium]
DFPVTSGAFQTNWAGGWDVFIVKLDSDGKRQWATYYGGNEGRLPDDEGFGIDTDKNGNVLITGRTTTTNFPVTNDAFQTNYGGGDFDVFIIKFTGNGIRQWASYYGGDGTDQGFGIATNSEGNVFITGDASSTNLPTTGAIQDSLVGSLDAFVAKFTSLNFLLAITNAPSEITMTSAMLNGTVYTRGDTTKVYFKYDTTQVHVNFDSVKAIQSPIIGITMVSVTAPLTNLLPNTTYYFRVVAEDNDGINDGADSTFTTPGPLEAPALSFPANGSIDISPIPTLRWNTVTGATSYRLQIARYSDFSTTVLNEGGITESSKTISGLASETRYHWRVQAFREGIASDSSAWSNVWNFTTGTKWILEHNVFFPSYGNPSDYRQTDYRIIGLPGANDVLVNSLFSGTQGKDWQVYRDNGNASTNPEDYLLAYDGSSHFLLGNGRAFWMINKGPLNINTSVDPPSMDNSNHAIIQLHEGWNLITNPFLTSVNWSDVKQANGIVEPIWKYNGTNGFDSLTTVFEPYIGYYFDAPSDLNSLKIPSPYVLQKKSVLAEEDPAMWRVRMNLSCGEFRDRTTSFGVAQNSSRKFDRLDFCKPRSVATSPIVSFYRPQWSHTYSTFATDIRPEFDEIESWDFEVRGVHQQNARLEFKGIEKIPEPMEIYLVDEGRGKYINLREQSSYNFRGIGDIMKFQVVVGKSKAVKDKLSEINMPKQFSLGNNYPNPFNPST